MKFLKIILDIKILLKFFIHNLHKKKKKVKILRVLYGIIKAKSPRKDTR
jgi:hypothetical protein